MTDRRCLTGKVAVVTGGESGIGRATALRLAHDGARVFVCDRTLHEENRDRFARAGIASTSCDVRSLIDLHRWIDTSASAGGRLDILVNNAGIGMTRSLDEVSESDWDDSLDINLKAAFFGCQFALPHFRRAGGGSVINTSSNAGILPRAHDPVYSISKLALSGLTRSLALCLSVERVRVNAVCPGPVGDTGMMNADLARAEDADETARRFIAASPLARAHERMITPEEVADAIAYLASDQAAMVTGTLIAIDGGKSLGVPPNPPGN